MQTYASISALVDKAWPGAGLTIVKNGQWQQIVHPQGPHVDLQLTRKEMEMPTSDFFDRVIQPAVGALRNVIERK